MTTATTVEDRLAEDGQRSDVKGMGADCSTSGQGQAAMDSLAGPLPRSPADIHTLPLSRPGSPSEVSGDTSTSHMVHQFPDQAKRVTYIWSPQLESLASDLPSNKDRSKYVHSLTRVMDLLDLGPGVSVDDLQADGGSVVLEEYARDPYELVGGSAASVAATSARRDQPLKARVVRPDLTLGAREVLERYHAEAYLDQIFRGSLQHPAGAGSSFSDSGSDETPASETDDSDSQHRAKRRKTANKLDKYGLLHDCPIFPTLPDYITHIAAATATACRLVANGSCDIAIHWDGGRHHAHRAKASGFCYVADIQLGIMLLLKEGVARASSRRSGVMCGGIAKPPNGQEDPGAQSGDRTMEEGDVEAERGVDEMEVGGGGRSYREVPPERDANARTATSTHITDESTTEPQPRRSKAKASRKPRVMYLDLDLHYGDGVASAFHSPAVFPYHPPHHDPPADLSTPIITSIEPLRTSQPVNKPPRPPKMPKAPNVLTISIHHSSPLFFPPSSPLSLLPLPSTPSPFTLSIPLHAYPSAKTYAAIWPAVEAVRRAYRPDYVVLQLGVDGLPGDPVGKYGNWSTHGEGGVNWVVGKVRGWGVGLVVLGGGGYGGLDSARAWAGATGVLVRASLRIDQNENQARDLASPAKDEVGADEKLGRDMDPFHDIPHHDHFTKYAPNYTIVVAPGNAKDENTPDYVRMINETYEVLARRISAIVGDT